MRNNLVEDLLLLARGRFGPVLPNTVLPKLGRVIVFHVPALGVTRDNVRSRETTVETLLRGTVGIFRGEDVLPPVTRMQSCSFIDRVLYYLSFLRDWEPTRPNEWEAYRLCCAANEHPFMPRRRKIRSAALTFEKEISQHDHRQHGQ